MDELTGLPLAFGKKAPLKKQTDTAARFETTKRRDPSPPPPVRPVTPIAQVPPLTVRLPCQQPTHNTALPPAPSNPAAPEGDTPDAASLSASPAAAHEDDIPITHEVILKDHVKVRPHPPLDSSPVHPTRSPPPPCAQTVSALSIDPAGARVVSGSYDYDCKLWDFGGMNASFKPFRTFEARAGHQVRRCPVSLSLRSGALRASSRLDCTDGKSSCAGPRRAVLYHGGLVPGGDGRDAGQALRPRRPRDVRPVLLRFSLSCEGAELMRHAHEQLRV